MQKLSLAVYSASVMCKVIMPSETYVKNPKVLSFSPQAFPHTGPGFNPPRKERKVFFPNTCMREQKRYYDPKSVTVGNVDS